MIDLVVFALTLLAALGSGVLAGLFFAFSVFVMDALGRLPAPVGIAAMQAINVAVLNAVFFAVFFGTAALSVLLIVAAFALWDTPGAAWLLAGAILHLVGSPVVTMRFNVPLNEALAKVRAESADGAALWSRYLAEWTSWNHVRTAACLAAAACFIVALWRGSP